MTVYRIFPLDGHEYIYAKTPTGLDTIMEAESGQPAQSKWRPVEVGIVHRENGKALAHADAPWGCGCLALRAAAISELAPIWRRFGEVLPLSCDEDDLFLFNATPTLDALDQHGSDILYFDDAVRVMFIHKYAFRPDIITGVDVFRLSVHHPPVFVSQHFVDEWLRAGLTGLYFKKEWSSD